MSDYKVGDYVIIKFLEKGTEYNGVVATEHMVKYSGKLTQVKERGLCTYVLDIDDSFRWSEEMLIKPHNIGDKVKVVNKDDDYYQSIGTIVKYGNIYNYMVKFDNEDQVPYDYDEIEEYDDEIESEPTKMVDVGYFISRDRKGVIENVFYVHGVASQYESHKVIFQDENDCRYVLPTEAIQWVVPHEEK